MLKQSIWAVSIVLMAAAIAEAQALGGSVDGLYPQPDAEVELQAGLCPLESNYIYNLLAEEENGQYYEAEYRVYRITGGGGPLVHLQTVNGFCPAGQTVWFTLDSAPALDPGYYRIVSRIRADGSNVWDDEAEHEFSCHEPGMSLLEQGQAFRRELLFQESS